jgi:hypothetical protein
MGFYFEKPAGFQFKAGQYLDITLVNPPETDAEGNIRSLSIASAPEDEHLLVATRMRDTAFKRVLRMASFDLEVKMEGPMVLSPCTITPPSRLFSWQAGLESRLSPAFFATPREPDSLTIFTFSIPIEGRKMRPS